MTERRETWAVVDLGFGDAGKGTVTDFLVRDRGAELVVRFHGGAQAGHNVVTDDGRHHTFAQFCAGLLAGAEGLLGPDFLLHPLGMAVEAEHLEQIGVRDPWARTLVDRRARVITPYQQAAVRIREQLRGAGAHGTTGVGIGECVADGLEHPEEVLRAGDLSDGRRIRARLAQQRARKREALRGLGATTEQLELFDDGALIERVVDTWRHVAGRLRLLGPDGVAERIGAARRVVLEGAQGVLLDEVWGFHPHTTWSDCTFAGAETLAGDREITRLGVIRAYSVRHGAGPFPTAEDVALPEPHNTSHGWQGRFRVGGLDGVLLRYALEVCGGVDGLAVTCLDLQPRPAACDAYRGGGPDELVRASQGRVHRLRPGPREDLGHRERLGQWLRSVEPVSSERTGIGFVEAATGQPVWLASEGPAASHKRWIRLPLPCG